MSESMLPGKGNFTEPGLRGKQNSLRSAGVSGESQEGRVTGDRVLGFGACGDDSTR
jgi:hypothetical protein